MVAPLILVQMIVVRIHAGKLPNNLFFYNFCRHHVVMHLKFCTFVVFIGSCR